MDTLEAICCKVSGVAHSISWKYQYTVEAAFYMIVGGAATYGIGRVCHFIANLF